MKKQRITYQGREYRLVEVPLDEVCSGCAFEHRHCAELPIKVQSCVGADGTTWDHVWHETLRSRLSHWWREWVKRNIVDDAPEEDERHSVARYSTLAEVNARRGYPIEEPKESSNDD